MSGEVLRGQGLCRRYAMGDVVVEALRAVDFTLTEGEFVVVLGHSGSGKSTLLNLLGGMDSPDEGRLFYRGQELTTFTRRQLARYRRETVGFVFQFFNLIPSLTARENVALAAELGGKSDPAAVDEALALVGLAERARHFPSQLSGGEQQRVAIARAVVKRPALLLCDEPTGALDTATGGQVIALLRRYNREQQRPVVVITHNADIARVADRVLTMRDGAIESEAHNDAPADAEDVTW